MKPFYCKFIFLFLITLSLLHEAHIFFRSPNKNCCLKNCLCVFGRCPFHFDADIMEFAIAVVVVVKIWVTVKNMSCISIYILFLPPKISSIKLPLEKREITMYSYFAN